jgi:hypothetical protein
MTIKDIPLSTLCDVLHESTENIKTIKAMFVRGSVPVWSAIRNHIKDAPIYYCDLIEKNDPLNEPTGSAIRFKEAYAYPAGAYPNHLTTLRIAFDVVFANDDHDVIDDYYYTGYRRNCLLDIPVSLVTNYSEEKFKKFCNDRRRLIKERYQEQAGNLLEKYTLISVAAGTETA